MRVTQLIRSYPITSSAESRHADMGARHVTFVQTLVPATTMYKLDAYACRQQCIGEYTVDDTTCTSQLLAPFRLTSQSLVNAINVSATNMLLRSHCVTQDLHRRTAILRKERANISRNFRLVHAHP